MTLLPIVFAELGRPLFGNQWLALLAVLAGIAVFLVLVALLGRWLAATHPNPPPAIVAVAERARELAPSHEIYAVIAAAVTTVFGARAHVAAVQLAPGPAHAPSVETLMVQWALEGRRQIYSSHKVR